jgi:hypothetical protein
LVCRRSFAPLNLSQANAPWGFVRLRLFPLYEKQTVALGRWQSGGYNATLDRKGR